MSERDIEYYKREYFDNKRSLGDIAKDHGTYPNKIRREMKNLGLELRTKGQAQKVAYSEGRSVSPTKGKKRTATEKARIGEARAAAWDTLSKSERREVSKDAKKRFDKKTREEKAKFFSRGHKALKKSAEEGSKIERAVLNGLIQAGYNAQFHKEQMLLNGRLQIDIFVPEKRVAIELDGPSHYEPIWGEDKLAKTKKSDKTKNGLLTMSGFSVIRVRTLKKSYSDVYGRTVSGLVLETLENIDTKKNIVIYIEA